MRKIPITLVITAFALCTVVPLVISCAPRIGGAQEVPTDPGWPRIIKTEEAEIVIYQPQIDTWDSYLKLEGWVAVEVTLKGNNTPIIGSVRMAAQTETDFEKRTVLVYDKAIKEVNIHTSDKALAQKVETMLRALEMSPEVIALDRVLAMAAEQEITVEQTAISVEPPRIFYSRVPAILVILDGEPLWSLIENTGLKYAVNTNWDLFLHQESGFYYLLNQNVWLTAGALDGSWKMVEQLPEEFKKIPDDENWAEVRANMPGTKVDAKTIPAVFVSTKPAELVVTNGDPVFAKIGETELLLVSNTDCDLFLHSGDKYYYYLISGRWFRARSLDGPWTFATDQLPADFASIPEDHEKAYVLTSVPGTKQANEAIVQAQIPQTADINIKQAEENIAISYDGEPEFKSIEGTEMSYAVNTHSDVVYVNNTYYLCSSAAWFFSPYPYGPWRVCTVVPPIIYTIPPAYPIHHVTYVHVYGYSPTTVTFGYTGGYVGIYVSFGVLCFGTGWYYPPYYYYHPGYYHPIYYPYPFSYGASVRYNPYTGNYTRSAKVYGPYGGAGRYASYDPSTGTYSRGRAAWGPYGGTGEAIAYNPRTGTAAGTRQSYNQYAQWGQSAVVTRQGEWAKAQHYTDSRGTSYGFETSRGTKGAGYVGEDSRGGIAKHGDDLYVGKDGQVYKHDENGWHKNEGGKWTSVPVSPEDRSGGRQMPKTLERQAAAAQTPSRQTGVTPRPQTGVQPKQQPNPQHLNQSYDARNRGTQRTQQFNSYQQKSTSTRQQPRSTGGARR